MPYYCTVPRCTSMAGKTKNVSFHQFPRDEELATLWNRILKRGKPYTKYSKVCSLHFRSEDYTVTSGQKNKGSWRTLKKNAIPSQNLPADCPLQQHQSSSQTPPPPMVDPRMHHQMAQAIYVQTMLAMQAASIISIAKPEPDSDNLSSSSAGSETSSPAPNMQTYSNNLNTTEPEKLKINPPNNKATYKCNQCSKCFKDPDVFILHQRTHTKENTISHTNQHTLRDNPILANLLERPEASRATTGGVFNINNIHSIENQIMMALAANMENYLQNLDTIMTPLSLINSGALSNEADTSIDENAIGVDSDDSQMSVGESDETTLRDFNTNCEGLDEEYVLTHKSITNEPKCLNLVQPNSVDFIRDENNAVIDKAKNEESPDEDETPQSETNDEEMTHLDSKCQDETSKTEYNNL